MRQSACCGALMMAWLACGVTIPICALAQRNSTFAPPAGPRFSAPGSATDSRLTVIVPGVYEFKDTCNVYAIVKGDEAVLIDFGSGDVLTALPSVGVRKVDWILHTHFHRDNTQGDEVAKAQGIRIAVPQSERRYFETAEEFWNNKQIFHLYDMRNEFMTRRKNIAIDEELKPDSTFDWNGLKLDVIGTPGHTEGSVSFKLLTGGRTVLFCGDLLASVGKIPTMYDLEWDYVGTRGLLAEIGSLNKVRDIDPDILAPSHGSPSGNVEEWTPSLLARIAKIYHEYDWINFSQWRPNPSMS